MTRSRFVAGALLLALPFTVAAQNATAEHGAALVASQKCTLCQHHG